MRDILKARFTRSSTTSSTHHVVVGIGTETFGVPAAQIHEIICLGDLDVLPRLPKGLTGPVRVLNKLVCLVKMQLPFLRTVSSFEATGRTCILVLKAHSAISSKIPTGVVVDRVDRILELDEDDIETFNTTRKGAWATCTLGFTGRQLPVVLLDFDRLIEPGATAAANTNGETATSRLRRRGPE